MGKPSTQRGHFGKYEAIVKANDPDRGDHKGWVYATVPAIVVQDGRGAPQPIEVWAAPSLPPTLFFVPDVDQRVWIEFIDGDVCRAVWTGVFYPQETPRTASGGAPKKEHHVIRTPGGSVIELDDTRGSEKVTVARGRATLVMEDGKITMQCGQSKLTLADDGIELAYGSQSGVKLDAASAKISHLAHKLEIDPTGAGLTDPVTGNAQGAVLAQALKLLGTHMHIAIAPGAPTSPSAEWNALAQLPTLTSKAG